MQYANGGFPQVYPAQPKSNGKAHYSAHITYNDNAIYHVLRLFKNICDDKEPYKSLEIDQKTKDKLKKCLNPPTQLFWLRMLATDRI